MRENVLSSWRRARLGAPQRDTAPVQTL